MTTTSASRSSSGWRAGPSVKEKALSPCPWQRRRKVSRRRRGRWRFSCTTTICSNASLFLGVALY
jgi:hypothetical protein